MIRSYHGKALLTISMIIIGTSLLVSESHATTVSASIYPHEGPAGSKMDVFFNVTSQDFRVYWDDLFLLDCNTSAGGTLPCMQNQYQSDHITFYAPSNQPPWSDSGVHNVTTQVWVGGVGFETNHFNFTIPVPPLQALLFWQGSATIVNQSVTFYASVIGGTTPYVYTWNFGDGMTGGGNPVNHTFLNKGNYTVTITTTDANAQTITTSQMISVIPLPKPVAGPQGSQGPPGPPGPQGPSGTQGASELPSNMAMISYIALGVSTLAVVISVASILFSSRRRAKD